MGLMDSVLSYGPAQRPPNSNAGGNGANKAPPATAADSTGSSGTAPAPAPAPADTAGTTAGGGGGTTSDSGTTSGGSTTPANGSTTGSSETSDGGAHQGGAAVSRNPRVPRPAATANPTKAAEAPAIRRSDVVSTKERLDLAFAVSLTEDQSRR